MIHNNDVEEDSVNLLLQNIIDDDILGIMKEQNGIVFFNIIKEIPRY